MDLGFQGRRVLAIVPHQDDEVIGMGGKLAHACRVAGSVHLVLVTDGAACGGVRLVRALEPCVRLCGLGAPVTPELEAHDASLMAGDGGECRHRPGALPPFEVVEDPERATNISCPAWGKQRDYEFLHVATTLGVPRENILFAYWDPESPEHIRDGETASGGVPLTPERMVERYARVSSHYFEKLRPEVVLTMAPYEFMPAPNDHWAMAHGVREAAAAAGVERVLYNHSGVLYQHVQKGGGHLGSRVELSPEAWETKRRALQQYLRWDPARGWFATAAHSVPKTFRALFDQDAGRIEYHSDIPEA